MAEFATVFIVLKGDYSLWTGVFECSIYRVLLGCIRFWVDALKVERVFTVRPKKGSLFGKQMRRKVQFFSCLFKKPTSEATFLRSSFVGSFFFSKHRTVRQFRVWLFQSEIGQNVAAGNLFTGFFPRSYWVFVWWSPWPRFHAFLPWAYLVVPSFGGFATWTNLVVEWHQVLLVFLGFTGYY